MILIFLQLIKQKKYVMLSKNKCLFQISNKTTQIIVYLMLHIKHYQNHF